MRILKIKIFIVILSVLILYSDVLAAMYPGFNKVAEKECVVLNDMEIQKLPHVWNKYKGFVKKCELRKNKKSKAIVSIVSVWANDYLDAHKQEIWENFPNTIIIDNQFNQCGTFPDVDIFPSTPPSFLKVYYGKWNAGIPMEIRIDVDNLAVSGDYYYAPLIWNEKIKKYEMKDVEEKSGKRPKK